MQKRGGGSALHLWLVYVLRRRLERVFPFNFKQKIAALLFWTQFIEAIHNFTIYTYVYNGRPLFGRIKALCVCFIVPGIPVAFAAGLLLNDYTNDHTCWISSHSIVYIGQTLWNIFCGCGAMVASESATLNIWRFPPHPKADHKMRNVAFVNCQVRERYFWHCLLKSCLLYVFVARSLCFVVLKMMQGTMLIALTTLLSWYLGSMAVNARDVSLYTVTSVTNMIAAIAMLVFHSMCNLHARQMLMKICCYFIKGKSESYCRVVHK